MSIWILEHGAASLAQERIVCRESMDIAPLVGCVLDEVTAWSVFRIYQLQLSIMTMPQYH